MTPFIFADLEHDEGREEWAYLDNATPRNWTIGVGHKLSAKPAGAWTQDQIDNQLHIDVASKVAQLDRQMPWWRTLNDARQDVILNMAFNMGVEKLLGFKHALAAMQTGDWTTASTQMLASAWAFQVKSRAARLALQMRTGIRAATR